MTESDPVPPLSTGEKTFSKYNTEQGKAYAEIRRNYYPSVYQTIIGQHVSTGGQLDTLLDVGCGPGIATQTLAPHFSHAIGIDPSDGMITTARSRGGITASSEPIQYKVSIAEELGRNLNPPVQDSSIDLITAANSAHWFDMERFWQSAARVLKPGGSVALWCSGEVRVHPSMPNAAAIQKAIDDNFEQYQRPYGEPGNMLTRNSYRDLPLPWTLAQQVPEFEETSFFRKVWDAEEPFHVGEQQANMNMFEKMMGTSSVVVRWRQAHPKAIGTEADVVRMLRREIERILHEAGIEKGKEMVKGFARGVLLIVKKKA